MAFAFRPGAVAVGVKAFRSRALDMAIPAPSNLVLVAAVALSDGESKAMALADRIVVMSRGRIAQ